MIDAKKKKLLARLGPGWFTKLEKEFDKPYLANLGVWLAERRKEVYVYPKAEHIFEAYNQTQPQNIKVVIIGQDPYHTPNIAHGLAFSSEDPFEVPPSLGNIFTEIENDIYNGLNVNLFIEANLLRWANQGVFLLNTILTVDKGKALSHAGKGWETLTRKTIEEICALNQPVVFMLWGKKAQEAYTKACPTPNSNHLILRAAHPAAEAYNANAGFFGCKHFSQANEFLVKHNLTPITW